MSGYFCLHLGLSGEGRVPSCFQFRGHQPVGRIGSIVLAPGAINRVASRLQIPPQSLTCLIPLGGHFLFCPYRRFYSPGTGHLEERLLDGIIGTKAAKGNAARLPIVHMAAVTGIAWD